MHTRKTFNMILAKKCIDECDMHMLILQNSSSLVTAGCFSPSTQVVIYSLELRAQREPLVES